MNEIKDIAGMKFGRLLAVRPTDKRMARKVVWECICDCGKTVFVSGAMMRRGNTRSCGCLHADLRPEIMRRTMRTHGATYSRTWNSWMAAKSRCFCKTDPAYGNYGGRGITMCDRWRHSFETFLADMGERPVGRTLDRKNNDGNYEPGNCRWATAFEQTHNRRQKVA